MSWEKEVEELRRREAFAEQMGGAEKVARQHGRGKLDARARIAGLVDAGSFREVGKIAGKGSYDDNGELTNLSASNLIFGRANIEGRAVVASADDFTVRGGAADAAIHRKMVLCEQMPHTLGIPLIRMIDGTGGGGSVKTLEVIGATYVPAVPGWNDVIRNLETVPVVALSLGPTAGLGAARVVASHYSVMVKGLSQLFAAGPAVVDGLGEGYKGSTDHQQAKESLSMRKWGARKKLSPGRGGSSPTCRVVSANPRLAPSAPIPPIAARRCCSLLSRARPSRSIRCARWSRRCLIRARCSKWGGCGAARSSPPLPG
jgi:hypothetical protein